MSFKALAWVDRIFIGQPGAKTCGIAATLAALAQFANEDGKCWPCQKSLSLRSRQSERTVRSNLGWLEEKGFLSREPRSSPDGRRSDLIQLNLDSEPMGTIKYPQPANSAGCATGKIGRYGPQILPVAVYRETVNETVTEKPAKKKKEKQPFAPPTVDEWISLFKERWPWVPTTRVRLSWQHYEDASWKRNDGTPIVNWKLAANTSYGFWLKDNPSEEAAWRRRNESEARQKPVSLAPSPVAGRHAVHTDMSMEMGDLMEKALRMAKERGQGRVSAITIFQNELGGHFE